MKICTKWGTGDSLRDAASTQQGRKAGEGRKLINRRTDAAAMLDKIPVCCHHALSHVCTPIGERVLWPHLAPPSHHTTPHPDPTVYLCILEKLAFIKSSTPKIVKQTPGVISGADIGR